MQVEGFEGATADLLDLWTAAFGSVRALPFDRFVEVLANKELLIAREAESIVGFVAFEQTEDAAAIAVVAVTPTWQRQGIGTALLRQALSILDAAGAATIRAGAGCGAYFWPGIPKDLGPACRLFEAAGFEWRTPTHDLCLSLRGFDGPNTAPPGIRIGDGTDSSEALLPFEQAHFPIWMPAYRDAQKSGRAEDIVVARDGDGIIRGTALLFAPGDYPWTQDLVGSVGGFGKVGVDPGWRRRGIGLALAAEATAILRNRGHDQAVVDWTDRPDWYGKLGYRIHRSYAMATRHAVQPTAS